MRPQTLLPLLLSLSALGLVLIPTTATAQVRSEALDVRGWPKEIQQGHRDFQKQCDGCHDLDLALEKHYAPRTWRKYIVRMIRKDDSELDTATGRRIYRFLTFYGRNRADLPPKKTAPKPEEEAPAPETPPEDKAPEAPAPAAP